MYQIVILRMLIRLLWLASCLVGAADIREKLLVNRIETNSLSIEGGFQQSPLFVTPLLRQNLINKATNLSQVHLHFGSNVTSYSGYFTVDEKYDSNLFFWFFESQKTPHDDPVLLWLQGGPGTSGLFGLFLENGPYTLINGTTIGTRAQSWTKEHSVLYLDSPVGTGFSFTTSQRYCTTEMEIADHLYEAIQQLFTMFPQLRSNQFYITGESYAGKYVPALGYKIHTMNKLRTKPTINLAGLAIGNGLTDPIHQLDYASYLYQLGLVDWNQRDEIAKMQTLATKYISTGKFEQAYDIFDRFILNNLNTAESTVFQNMTGYKNIYNFMQPDPMPDVVGSLANIFTNHTIRYGLHVGDEPYQTDVHVKTSLKEDIVQSVAPWLAELLGSYRVLIYSGRLDIIVAYPFTINYLQKLQFPGKDLYLKAKRCHLLNENGTLSGYIKTGGNLTEALILNAGHMVPYDQPDLALYLITSFTQGISLGLC